MGLAGIADMRLAEYGVDFNRVMDKKSTEFVSEIVSAGRDNLKKIDRRSFLMKALAGVSAFLTASLINKFYTINADNKLSDKEASYYKKLAG